MKKKIRRRMRELDGGLSKRIAELMVEEMKKIRAERNHIDITKDKMV